MIPGLRDTKPIGDELGPHEFGDLDIENRMAVKSVQRELEEATQAVHNAGRPVKGKLNGYERIELLVDLGTFLPLNTLYNPKDNKEGATGVITGLAEVAGRQVVVIASDNKLYAGAWLPGQPDKIERAQNLAELLHIPIMWLLECSGLRLDDAWEVYTGRGSGGDIFYRNARLMRKGIPIIGGVFGTNPAGGGYHAISLSVIFAHKDASFAVGGAAILSGMNPEATFTVESAYIIAEALRRSRYETPPGSAQLHFEKTGFVKAILTTEEEVISAMRKHLEGCVPAGSLEGARVEEPRDPLHDPEELNFLVPFNQKQHYDMRQVVSRFVDASSQTEYKPDYGPEVYCGVVRIDGLLVGLVANYEGKTLLPEGYPPYILKSERAQRGKLYREGLIKMRGFVELCAGDNIPMLWLQDTWGIDVGDKAESTELLGLGQALIVSIEASDIPMLTVVLRKGSTASHYVMAGPQSQQTAFMLGTPTTEIYVMDGGTAAIARYGGQLERAQSAGDSLEPIIEKMNAMKGRYKEESRPIRCAQRGYVDEIVLFPDLRKYMVAFVRGAYQGSQSLRPQHLLGLPRDIQDA